jgi:hypothetical protein
MYSPPAKSWRIEYFNFGQVPVNILVSIGKDFYRQQLSESLYSNYVAVLYGLSLSQLMLANLAHPNKASTPIEVTLSGIVMPVKPVHPENAISPNEVAGFPSIESGISISVS